MKQCNKLVTLIFAVLLSVMLGCASSPTQKSAGDYVDDSVITTKVKAALFDEPTLKSFEFKVKTYKGTVQLSGFVRSDRDIDKAITIARGVPGVSSVKNDMELK